MNAAQALALTMQDSWPMGVDTASDMRLYAATLFGADKEIEDLLLGTDFVRSVYLSELSPKATVTEHGEGKQIMLRV